MKPIHHRNYPCEPTPFIQATIPVTVMNQSETPKEVYFINVGVGICFDNVPFVVQAATVQPRSRTTYSFPQRTGFSSNYFVGIKDERRPNEILLSRSILTPLTIDQEFRTHEGRIVEHLRLPLELFTGC